ncbi:hypothetical protein OIU84_022908 [Salix udensis]|uniref:Uncharacterized protein n=1 Tax=Salix udensis TaxID=889485 RepID=A0AAD6KPM0_9ROSI|nr:hypothetical protein OIU84_022908 [Salix udensis]
MCWPSSVLRKNFINCVRLSSIHVPTMYLLALLANFVLCTRLQIVDNNGLLDNRYPTDVSTLLDIH